MMRIISRQPRLAVNIRLSFGSYYLLCTYLPISLSHPRSIFFNVSNKPIRVASIVGADLMVRKSVLSQVGAFAPEFFMNYEETELCHRIHKAKFVFILSP